MRVDVSLTQEQVSEPLIFADDLILSFKPHDTGVFREDIDIKGLVARATTSLSISRTTTTWRPDPVEP